MADLIAHCTVIRERAASGKLVYDLNFDILAGTAQWNVDLVIGEPPPGNRPTPSEPGIRRARPSTVHIAIEHKAVMTEHRKAIKNRKRDFEAHHEHVHHYSPRTIAGAVLIVNAADRFKSPLRATVTTHRDPAMLVSHCIAELRAVGIRSGIDAVGLDASTAIVVDFDNQNLAAARYATGRSVPRVGDPLHYDAFIQRICALYTAWFAG